VVQARVEAREEAAAAAVAEVERRKHRLRVEVVEEVTSQMEAEEGRLEVGRINIKLRTKKGSRNGNNRAFVFTILLMNAFVLVIVQERVL